MVDVDAYLESLQPPTIKINGVTHVGKFLSHDEYMPFMMMLNKVGSSEAEDWEIKKLILDYCGKAFPRTRKQWWSDLFRSITPFVKPNPTVGAQVIALPPTAMMKVMIDFFQSQARALNVQPVVDSISEQGEE
jgi:hypothetical protein